MGIMHMKEVCLGADSLCFIGTGALGKVMSVRFVRDSALLTEKRQ